MDGKESPNQQTLTVLCGFLSVEGSLESDLSLGARTLY